MKQNTFDKRSYLLGYTDCMKNRDEFAIDFAEWCIKKRVDFFDDTEIGRIYTMMEGHSRYKMKELLEIFKKEKDYKQQ